MSKHEADQQIPAAAIPKQNGRAREQPGSMLAQPALGTLLLGTIVKISISTVGDEQRFIKVVRPQPQ